MIPITKRHTAQYTAEAVTVLIKRLKIEDKVWFVTSDNASTNTAMMRILGNDRSLPLIEGEATQVRCIAHILNLISEAIIRPFNKAVRDAQVDAGDEEQWSSGDDEIVDGSEPDEEDPAVMDQDNDFSASLRSGDAEDSEREDEELIARAMAAKKVAYAASGNRVSGTVPPAPSETLTADSSAVGLQIRQLAWFARKLRYNYRLRSSFQETCALFKLPKPHTLIRDVATRWNSTFEMVERGLVLWEAIITWQEANQKLIPVKFRLQRAHKTSFTNLVKLLQPLSRATSKFSSKTSPALADVVGTFEELDASYSAFEEDENLPTAWREAAKRASAVCATYYGLADDTKAYYLAVLLHPNMRPKFMRIMKWEKEWIQKAVDTLKDVHRSRYKKDEQEPDSNTQSQDVDGQTDSQKRKARKKELSFVEQRLQQAEEEDSEPDVDPLDEWCKGKLCPVTLVKGKLVDPLAWWNDQKRIGCEHGGLTDLALDLFSAPATSVDVERLFSKAGHHITPLRHRIKAVKLGQMVTVGAWHRENWVPEDLLSNYYHQRSQEKLKVTKRGSSKRTLDDAVEAGPSKRMRVSSDDDAED
ncbi:hypothetical protein CF327_g6278 [Tilletia walkeri]|nr:hypothetical protein CF327_g6278 [Tilletia walkeri]